MPPERIRRAAAELLGSLLLSAAVIGSGIMAERLAGGSAALALLANTAATMAMLVLLISVLGPVSGAHFNPAVTAVMSWRGAIGPGEAVVYMLAQVAGCCAGAVLAHAMFNLPLLQASTHARSGGGMWLAEIVATFGLLLVILGARRDEDVPWLVAAWIGAAYWFTSSTSFANPAITIGRSLTDTFAGIQPVDAPAFVVAQFAGAILAVGAARLLFAARFRAPSSPHS